MLGFFFGVDLYSVTVVVAAYMAGLGLGNLAGGHMADRISKRVNILMFAGAEMYIGIFALLSKGIFYDYLYMQKYASGLTPWVANGIVFLGLLCPTFVMGLSLPFLARANVHDAVHAARRIGILYGTNTLGASIGALVTTFFLFTIMPMGSILIVGAMINICVSLLSLFLMRFSRAIELSDTRIIQQHMHPVVKTESFRTIAHLILLSAFSGYVGLSMEIIWFRILGIALKNTSHTFGILLGIYLLALGIGNILGSKFVIKNNAPLRTYLLVQIGTVLYAGIFIIVITQLLGESGPLSLLWWYFRGFEVRRIISTDIWISVYMLFPIVFIWPSAFMMGINFPYLQKSIHSNIRSVGGHVGLLQAANIVGCIIGTISTSLFLLSWAGTAGALRFLLVVSSVPLFLWGVLYASNKRQLYVFACMNLILFVTAAYIPSNLLFWSALHGIKDREAVHIVEDSTGVTVMRRVDEQGNIAVISGGRDASWIPYGQTHTLLGVLPVLIHADPKEIAVIGLGSGDTLFHIGGHSNTTRITSIEIVSSQQKALKLLRNTIAYKPLSAVMSDERISFIHDDARTYLMRTGKKFDVIEADALWPDAAYSGNLYSYEYFLLLKNSLRPGGIALSWIPTQRTLDTFIKAFPYVFTIGSFAVGSELPIYFDSISAMAQLQHPYTRAYYLSANPRLYDYVESYITTHDIQYYDDLTDRSSILDINRDLYPKDEFLFKTQ